MGELGEDGSSPYFQTMDAGTALLIGNFDGVHLGHVALVEHARQVASVGGHVIALAFDPHPVTVLRPGSEPRSLTTPRQRATLLAGAGCDEVRFMEPTRQRLGQPPEEFIEWIVEEFKPRWIVEGSDFRFGKGRAGDLENLRSLGKRHGFEVIEVPGVQAHRADLQLVEVRSGLIRDFICRGRIRDAAMLLGRPHALEGTVIKGEQRGRELGFPTANLDHGTLLLPADGIYAGTAVLGNGDKRIAAISVGTKPTFDEQPRVCEVHMLDHDGPLDDYGWTLEVRFEHWLRDQVAYEGVDPLVDQLHRDLAETRRRMECQPITG